MDNPLSVNGPDMLRRELDRTEVLRDVVLQLRKDLGVGEDGVPLPVLTEGAFAVLSGHVLAVLRELGASGSYALRTAMYRVDIPENHLDRTLARGGMSALADEVVLRALQKVLTRARFAGRF